MFDVKQLRVLKAVSDHGSFSAAADALSYTQPAISQQVAALEKRAGTTLVDRGSRGVRLTDAGQALVGASGCPRSPPRAPRCCRPPSPSSPRATRRWS
jgi:DNA-binding transcriptional LysR family regulator